MVIDTSALIAILRLDPDAQLFAAAIVASSLRRSLERARIQIAPYDDAQARMAREAFLRYGKGRHPAALNFGDCASYALARVRRLPLLFKGEDFARTDILRALA